MIERDIERVAAPQASPAPIRPVPMVQYPPRNSRSVAPAAMSTSHAIVQAKLSVGPVGDQREREADAVADQASRIQRAPGSGLIQRNDDSPAAPRIQRRATLIQRLPASDTLPQSADLGAVRAKVDGFHALADTATFQERLRSLKALDDAIYAWFTAHPSSDIDAQPGGPQMRSLLIESETEHRKLVDAVRADGNALPIDTTGMTDVDRAALLVLWKSIAAQQGNIKLAGDPAFLSRTYARLAKILQTSIGRELLTYLDSPDPRADAPKDQTVTIFGRIADLDASFKDMEGGRDSNSSYARSVDTVADDTADQHFLQPPNSNGADTTFTDATSPNDIRQAILAGKGGVNVGGEAQAFGTGSSVVVKMSEPAPDPNEDKRMYGAAQGEEIINPSFVTLAHELGHAMKIRAGALVSNVHKDNPFFNAFEGDVKEQQLWDNAEEYVNIEDVENSVRAQSGISERKYHKPVGSVDAAKRSDRANAALNGLVMRDAVMGDDPEWRQLWAAHSKAKKDLTYKDKGFTDALMGRIDALDQKATPAYTRAARVPFVDPKIDLLRTKIRTAVSGSGKRGSKFARSAEFSTLLDEVCNELRNELLTGKEFRITTERLDKYVASVMTNLRMFRGV